MPQNRKIRDIADINILSGMKTRSRKEQLAIDHPGHMMEYIFNIALATFQWEWIELIMEAFKDPLKNSPCCIIAPRNHGKTYICVEGITCWHIGKYPTRQNQVISSTDEIAKQRVKKVGQVIRYNEKYRNLFGELYPGSDQTFRWSPSGEAIDVKIDREAAFAEGGDIARDATLIALGILTSVEGGRANLQVFDDVVNQRNSQSEVTRHQVLQRFEQAFMPMLYPDGVRIIVGTRYHYKDLYGYLIPKLDQDRFYTALYADDMIDKAFTVSNED